MKVITAAASTTIIIMSFKNHGPLYQLHGIFLSGTSLTVRPNAMIRDSRKSRQKWLKTWHTFVNIAKITAKSRHFI